MAKGRAQEIEKVLPGEVDKSDEEVYYSLAGSARDKDEPKLAAKNPFRSNLSISLKSNPTTQQ